MFTSSANKYMLDTGNTSISSDHHGITKHETNSTSGVSCASSSNKSSINQHHPPPPCLYYLEKNLDDGSPLSKVTVLSDYLDVNNHHQRLNNLSSSSSCQDHKIRVSAYSDVLSSTASTLKNRDTPIIIRQECVYDVDNYDTDNLHSDESNSNYLQVMVKPTADDRTVPSSRKGKKYARSNTATITTSLSENSSTSTYKSNKKQLQNSQNRKSTCSSSGASTTSSCCSSSGFSSRDASNKIELSKQYLNSIEEMIRNESSISLSNYSSCLLAPIATNQKNFSPKMLTFLPPPQQPPPPPPPQLSSFIFGSKNFGFSHISSGTENMVFNQHEPLSMNSETNLDNEVVRSEKLSIYEDVNKFLNQNNTDNEISEQRKSNLMDEKVFHNHLDQCNNSLAKLVSIIHNRSDLYDQTTCNDSSLISVSIDNMTSNDYEEEDYTKEEEENRKEDNEEGEEVIICDCSLMPNFPCDCKFTNENVKINNNNKNNKMHAQNNRKRNAKAKNFLKLIKSKPPHGFRDSFNDKKATSPLSSESSCESYANSTTSIPICSPSYVLSTASDSNEITKTEYLSPDQSTSIYNTNTSESKEKSSKIYDNNSEITNSKIVITKIEINEDISESKVAIAESVPEFNQASTETFTNCSNIWSVSLNDNKENKSSSTSSPSSSSSSNLPVSRINLLKQKLGVVNNTNKR